jgi:hypothetical protein
MIIVTFDYFNDKQKQGHQNYWEEGVVTLLNSSLRKQRLSFVLSKTLSGKKKKMH